ncbi:formamidopyrimidine-dna glycosylase, partial [Dissoconium aciculare CBS 342.82]|uniref:Formamidopyrimidine-dna glycosylase n=1 Tax=Dissoconium aciculare CBS 342.82 TaxID=1314786 RepID=A0A6J3M200_9PEZI
MPEIGEVARIVHYLRKHLVNRTIRTCQGFEDDIVYGKVGCSATAFQKAVEGKKVIGAGQQGKYFYVTLSAPPHAVMHLGMTGWIKFSAEETGYYKQAKESKTVEEWPPKYMKFLLKCDPETVDGEDRDALEIAFIDARRLARIRLVDCEASKIRQESPLKENGPDPVIDKDRLTVEFLTKLLRKKKVPVKALLLDQANISGVGNWVADEILYQARIHPEQYSNTFDDEQIKRIHDELIGVCTTACELLADSSRFPENWLMKYRWDKGKKDANVLPNGAKIVHLKVGGRTSAVVPSVQKKTAAVAGDVDSGDDDVANAPKSAKGSKRKAKAEPEDDDEDEDFKEEQQSDKRSRTARASAAKPTPSVQPAEKKGRGKKVKTEESSDDADEKPTGKARAKKSQTKKEIEVNDTTK